MTDGNGYHGEFAELKCYLQSKLMWNPDRDIEPLIDRFMAAYYGAAAPLVRRYFNELYASFNIRNEHNPDPDAEPSNAGIYGENLPQLTEEKLDRWTALWREAETAVKDDAQREYNVRMSALPVLYVRQKKPAEPRLGGVVDGYDFAAGLRVRWLPHAAGRRRTEFPRGTVSQDWAWHDIGEFDFSELQKLPLPTMDGLVLFVQGDVELDRIEVLRGSPVLLSIVGVNRVRPYSRTSREIFGASPMQRGVSEFMGWIWVKPAYGAYGNAATDRRATEIFSLNSLFRFSTPRYISRRGAEPRSVFEVVAWFYNQLKR